ncbi:hypothetical protein EV215_2044 [Hypnocyclicus thermotrophus]|uniref:DUF5050 domain-containing protein n=1 Tax=Hypnocyclicus thermotrophus TaxID=1627895 RepID=A0AA46DX06_9FUSO|nr:hypothetical protein [Hypnocyclicus thermotrophus]TDT67366.1 hypothetical protein EV215_2044 [Hypnocyclicus thermotrophus]
MKKYIIIFFIALHIFTFAEIKTLNTKYFNFIYENELEDNALELLKNSENIANKIFEFFNYYPQNKITVILNDNYDYSYTYSDNDEVYISATSPSLFDQEKNYDNWFLYSFSINLTKTVIYKNVNGWFGRLPFSKYTAQKKFLPKWYVNGLATYVSSIILEKGITGNPISNKFKMQLKANILENKFNGFELSNGYYNNNQENEYGYYFIKFFVDTYGENKLKEAISYISNHQLFQPYDGFLKISGVNDEILFLQYYKNYLKTTFNISNKNNLVSGKTISQLYFNTIKNLQVKNRNLFFISNNNIYSYNIINNNYNRVYNKAILNYTLGDNNIYFSKVNYNNKENTYYSFSYKKSKNIKKISIERAINYINIDGKIAYIINKSGKQKLVLDNGKILINFDENFLFEKFYYDSLNYKLYFSAVKIDEKTPKIYELNLENNEINFITEGYSPFIEGDYLYFVNSINGTYNIFSYNFENNKILQLTNVLYGAFEPIVINENLYFSNYTSNGYTLNKLNLNNSYSKLIKTDMYDRYTQPQENIIEEVDRTLNIDDLEIKEFRDNFVFQNTNLTIDSFGSVFDTYSATFSNVFKTRFFKLGISENINNGKYNNSSTGIFFKNMYKNNQTGIFFNYFDNTSLNIYLSNSTTYSYAKFKYHYPLKSFNNINWFNLDLSFDSNKKYDFDLNYDKKIGSILTLYSDNIVASGYLKTKYIKVKASLAKKAFYFNDILDNNEYFDISNKSSNSIIYNIYSRYLLISKLNFNKTISINRGVPSGTYSLKNYKFNLDTYHILSSGLTQNLVLNTNVTGNGFIFTHIPVNLGIGILNQINISNKNWQTPTIYLKSKINF